MDYSKLTKEELIKLCEKNNLNFSSNMAKIELEKILIANANNNFKNINENKKDSHKYSNNNEVKKIKKPDGVGSAGAILNIVFSSIGIAGLIASMCLGIFLMTFNPNTHDHIINKYSKAQFQAMGYFL